jgi:transposase
MDFDPRIVAGLPPEFFALVAELVARVEKLEAENAALRAENAALRAENAELKRRLGMNSTNSSKPPSTDSLNKPDKPERREGSGTRKGKRERKGKTRPDFGAPDKVQPVRSAECPDCRVSITDLGTLVERSQVAELVAKPFEITEYQFYEVTCPCCGKVVAPPAAPGILPGFSLGPRMVAFIGMLDHFGNVTYNKIETILREGFGLPISEGTIDNANKWLHAALAAPLAELKEVLPNLPHAHIDETGWRIDGKKHWLWGIATPELTFLHIASSRGAQVLLGLLSGAFTGLISCDFWSAYRSKDGVGGERTFCWSHLDREAKGIIDNGQGDTADFGRVLRRLIHRGYVIWRGFKRGRIGEEIFRRLTERLKLATRAAIEAYSGKLTGKKPIALHKRLDDYLDGYFNWSRYPGLPPDNNPGEQAVRSSVVNRKVSGGNRSAWGAELTAFMQTVVGTCRKQGLQVLETLQAYLLAFAQPGLTYPTLVPASLTAR